MENKNVNRRVNNKKYCTWSLYSLAFYVPVVDYCCDLRTRYSRHLTFHSRRVAPIYWDNFVHVRCVKNEKTTLVFGDGAVCVLRQR